MPVHLLSLPLEIRCQIFSYLLTSPSRYVTTLPPGPWIFSILPWDLRQELMLDSRTGTRSLDLSLLRVCRELNRECKELLWERNTFVYRPFEIYCHSRAILEKGLGALACARRVVMHVDVTVGGRGIDAVASALDTFSTWSKCGDLEEVALIVVNERRKPFHERDPVLETRMRQKASLERVIRFRTGDPFTSSRGAQAVELSRQAKECYQAYLSVFSQARDGCLAHVRRKMIVNTNFGSFSPRGQRKYLQDALMDPNELMAELNAAFGGELLVDGNVCFRDGIRMRNAFQTSLKIDESEVLDPDGADSLDGAELEGSTTAKGIEGYGDRVQSWTPWGQFPDECVSMLDLQNRTVRH